MDIFEMLRLEHVTIRQTLDELVDKTTGEEVSGDPNIDWTELFLDFKQSLVAHDRAEETTLYDQLRITGHADLVNVKIKEHHLLEELLEDLEEIDPRDRAWADKLSVLENQLDAHFNEEETTVFSVLQPFIDSDTSQRLVTDFESLRDDIIEGIKYHPKGRSRMNPAGLDLDRT